MLSRAKKDRWSVRSKKASERVHIPGLIDQKLTRQLTTARHVIGVLWGGGCQLAHKLAKRQCCTYLLMTTDGCIPSVVIITVVEGTRNKLTRISACFA